MAPGLHTHEGLPSGQPGDRLSTRRQPPCGFSFIVEQAVLERHTGGEDVTRELLDHLLEMFAIDRHWNVQVQIMPLRQPEHPGMAGPLRLLETPDNRWFTYSEGQENGRLISDRKAISVLHQRYAKLRSQALTPEDSRSVSESLRFSWVGPGFRPWWKTVSGARAVVLPPGVAWWEWRGRAGGSLRRAL
ncbi:hypothetical protein QFZ74_005302 [Streptomyces sp. V3I7]|nr:hypothetical protein [Streptomyces sp. V3I7]